LVTHASILKTIKIGYSQLLLMQNNLIIQLFDAINIIMLYSN